MTLVLEAERGRFSPEVLDSVECIAKQLAIAANVILILSEANAGLNSGDDDRQQFIWVDEMSFQQIFPALGTALGLPLALEINQDSNSFAKTCSS